MDSDKHKRVSQNKFLRKLTDLVRGSLHWPRSYRLRFFYDEKGLRLVKRTARLQPAPASDPLDRISQSNSIVAEVRTSKGVVVYRKKLYKPIPQDVEVFDQEGTPTRLRLARTKGTFSIVVPNLNRRDIVAIDAGPDVILSQAIFDGMASKVERWMLIQVQLKGD